MTEIRRMIMHKMVTRYSRNPGIKGAGYPFRIYSSFVRWWYPEYELDNSYDGCDLDTYARDAEFLQDDGLPSFLGRWKAISNGTYEAEDE